jgi:ornithine decarboxylase
VDEKTLLRLAKSHGTPLVVVDHKVLRENYAQFRRHLPRVQAYYAVKANAAPEIVRTFYEVGASFDVASVAEFLTVHENVRLAVDAAYPDWPRDRQIGQAKKFLETVGLGGAMGTEAPAAYLGDG